jgi:hypothetical protein
VAQRAVANDQLRITPQLHEALSTLSNKTRIPQGILAERMIAPVLTLADRFGWYRVIEDLETLAVATAVKSRKPRRKGEGLQRTSIFTELLG